jgi:regulator of protease activity HflC (stomatin/prohibitin superfamily)
VAKRCSFRVEEGHSAVLTRFGAAREVPGTKGALLTYPPGLHFKWPWDKVHAVAMMEQSLDLSGEEGGRSAMAADGTRLRFDSILRFVPEQAQLSQFLFGLRAPMEHITGVFTCLLRNEIANFEPAKDAPRTKLDEGSYALIRRQRKLLNQRIEDFCKRRIGERYGVRFSAVDLTDILPPDELADALNAVMNAQAEAASLYARTEAECQQRVLAAGQGVEVARRRSEAAEREVTTLAGFLQELSSQGTLGLYVSRRRAEVLAQSRSLFFRSES